MRVRVLYKISMFLAVFCLSFSYFSVVSISAGASYIFEDGFESGDFSAWDSTPAGNGWANVISAEPFQGNYHANFSTINDGYAWARKDFPAESSVYLRAYVRPKDRSAGAYAGVMSFVNSTTNYNIARVLWSTNGYWTLYYRNGTVPTWKYQYSSVLASNDVWYCLELYHKSGNGNGENKLWINGKLEVSLTGLNNSDYGNPGRIAVGKVEGTDDGIPVVYVDSVVLSTSYIGTGARAYLVVRGMDNGIYYRSYDGSWGSWAGLPGSTSSSTGAAILSNTLHVVVTGLDGGLYHGSVNLADSTFSGWLGISGATPSAPTLASNGSNLYLVVRGMDDQIYYNVWNGGWGSWTQIPGSTTASPAAAVVGGVLHIVVQGYAATSLYHGSVNLADSTFSGWTLLSGGTPSAPALASDGTSLYLVVRGEDDQIYYSVWNGGWGSWMQIPGSTTASPAAAVVDGALHIVVQGFAATSLWHGNIDLGTQGFSGWTQLSGETPSAPRLSS